MEKKANHFSGQLGFVMAAAGSAVGVGNLWRFPYLAAKDGGGLFLIVYLALVLTFGFTLLAGAMIIPAVYVFSGVEGMSAGPSLMFISLPKVFHAMGKAGGFVGLLFFVAAIFATLTSCISVLESITTNCVEVFHTERKKTVVTLSVIYLAASAVVALGYSLFYFEAKLPNGTTGQLLDVMDYVSNSVMMPFIALLSTILIGWVKKPSFVIEEMESSGHAFRRKRLYTVMIRYIAPVMMFVLFLQSTGILSGIFS